MGQRDLKKMKANLMDPQGMGSTQAGWICGIIGTAFGGLMSLCCVGYMVMIFGMTASMGRMATPPPTVRPATPVAPPAPSKAQMDKSAEKGGKARQKKAPQDDEQPDDEKP